MQQSVHFPGYRRFREAASTGSSDDDRFVLTLGKPIEGSSESMESEDLQTDDYLPERHSAKRRKRNEDRKDINSGAYNCHDVRLENQEFSENNAEVNTRLSQFFLKSICESAIRQYSETIMHAFMITKVFDSEDEFMDAFMDRSSVLEEGFCACSLINQLKALRNCFASGKKKKATMNGSILKSTKVGEYCTRAQPSNNNAEKNSVEKSRILMNLMPIGEPQRDMLRKVCRKRASKEESKLE